MAWILICPECENRFESDNDTDLRQEICCPACRKFSPPEDYSVLMFCPECRSKLAIPLDMLQEQELQCPKCKTSFSVDTTLSLNTDLSVETTFYADAGQVLKSRQMLEDGAFFDKFKIIRLLGKGGMGEVYLAEHLLLKRQSALKVMKNSADDPVFIKRFIREAKLANRIQHPGLISVFDIGHDIKTDYLFIAMEYVEGYDVGSILKERHLSESEILGIAKEVLAPLKVLEQEKIVHRDIKPSNIMITTEGKVKLADLGIAKVENSEYGEFTLTQDNSVFGTPEYASPEQCHSSHNVDCRSDIYSLGATMYHLAARRPPFSGDTAMATILNVMQHDPVPLHELDRNISIGFSLLVQDMMRKDPNQRPRNIAELEERMRDVNNVTVKERRFSWQMPQISRKSIVITVEVLIFTALVGVISHFIANGYLRTWLEEALKIFGGTQHTAERKYSGSPRPMLSSDGKILRGVSNGTSLKRFKIPEGVEVVEGIYSLNNIETLEIPASVRIINTGRYGISITSQCGALQQFAVAPDNPNFSAADGVLFSKNRDKLICYPPSKPGAKYTVPESVKDISAYAFAYNRYLEEVSGFENVGRIEPYTFYSSNLSRVVLPENVRRLEKLSFAMCSNLSTVVIKGKPYVAPDAFRDTRYIGSVETAAATPVASPPPPPPPPPAPKPQVPKPQVQRAERSEMDFSTLAAAGAQVTKTGDDTRTIAGRLERCRRILKELRGSKRNSKAERNWISARIRFTEKQLKVLEKQMANRRLAVEAGKKRYDENLTSEVQRRFREWTAKRTDWGYNSEDMKFAAELIELLDKPGVNPNVRVVDSSYSRYSGPIIEAIQSGRIQSREKIEEVLFRRHVDISGIKFGRMSSQAIAYGIDNLMLGRNVSGARLLQYLEAGADPNVTFAGTGETALHWAARRNSREDVQNLLLAGADVTILDKQGQTPLIWAEKFHAVKVKSLLLAAGCDRNHKDFEGRTAADYRIEGQFRNAVVKEDLNKVRELIGKVNPDMELADRDTPLIYACKKLNYNLAKLLLDHKANPDLRTGNGYLPLQHTFFYGHDESHRTQKGMEKNFRIFSLLLEKGANPYISPRGYGGYKSLLSWMSTNSYFGHDIQRQFEVRYAGELAKYIKNLNPADSGDVTIIRFLKEKNIKVDVEIKEAVFSRGGRVIAYCPENISGEDYNIPAGVTEVGSKAFAGNRRLKNIVIPEGVATINYNAFDGCSNLRTVKLPSTLKSINSKAFKDCVKLEEVILPEGTLSVGMDAFYGCSALKTVKFPSTLKTIEYGAFMNCPALKDIRIPEGVNVAKGAFLPWIYPGNGEKNADKAPEKRTIVKQVVITCTVDQGAHFRFEENLIRYMHSGSRMPERVFVNGVRWKNLTEPFKLSGYVNASRAAVKKTRGRGNVTVYMRSSDSSAIRIWDGQSGSDRYRIEVEF